MNLESNVDKSLVRLQFSDFYRLGSGAWEYSQRMEPFSYNPHYSELLPIIKRNRRILGVFHMTALFGIIYGIYQSERWF